MADVRFTETSPSAGLQARVVTFIGASASDLVSDPMTVTITAAGFQADGTPVSVEVEREYAKADWSGEVL